MIQEFKDFITKGNLLTLAVGFIMGLAFAALVTSFVEDVVMPIVAIPFGQPDFGSLTVEINDSMIRYGSFLTAAIVFLLTTLAVFLFIVKPYSAWEARQLKEEEAPAEPTELEVLQQIRDSLARSS